MRGMLAVGAREGRYRASLQNLPPSLGQPHPPAPRRRDPAPCGPCRITLGASKTTASQRLQCVLLQGESHHILITLQDSAASSHISVPAAHGCCSSPSGSSSTSSSARPPTASTLAVRAGHCCSPRRMLTAAATAPHNRWKQPTYAATCHDGSMSGGAMIQHSAVSCRCSEQALLAAAPATAPHNCVLHTHQTRSRCVHPPAAAPPPVRW